MKKLLAVAILVTASLALAQNPVQRYASATNDGITGTTINTVTSINSAGKAIITTTGCTGIVGVTVGGAGVSGSAIIAMHGVSTSVVFDGATTAGDYFTCSTTVAGDAHDTGSPSFPSSGWGGGIVLSTNAGAGTYAVLLVGQQAIAGANTALSNLVSPAINATLEFAATKSVGDTTAPPQYVCFYGTGTQGSDSICFTGAPTGNRTVTFQDAAGTVGLRFTGSASITPAALSDGDCEQPATTIAITGANAGDPVLVGPPATIAAGLYVLGVVTAANTVTVQICNLSGGALTPVSGTYAATIVH
jgi:hypothetical protein